jgi:holin-like protein
MDDSFAAYIQKIRKEKRIIMKYLKQFLIILVISLIGELLNKLLPLPVPASIYGMVILFIGLLSGVIKLSSVKEAGSFLIEIMPVMFIPAGVGLMSSWLNLKPIIIPVCIITVATIFTVMIVSGHVTQFIVKRTKKNDELQ